MYILILYCLRNPWNPGLRRLSLVSTCCYGSRAVYRFVFCCDPLGILWMWPLHEKTKLCFMCSSSDTSKARCHWPA